MTYLPTRDMAFHEADQLWRGTIIAANANEVGTWGAADHTCPYHHRQQRGRPAEVGGPPPNCGGVSLPGD